MPSHVPPTHGPAQARGPTFRDTSHKLQVGHDQRRRARKPGGGGPPSTVPVRVRRERASARPPVGRDCGGPQQDTRTRTWHGRLANFPGRAGARRDPCLSPRLFRARVPRFSGRTADGAAGRRTRRCIHSPYYRAHAVAAAPTAAQLATNVQGQVLRLEVAVQHSTCLCATYEPPCGATPRISRPRAPFASPPVSHPSLPLSPPPRRARFKVAFGRHSFSLLPGLVSLRAHPAWPARPPPAAPSWASPTIPRGHDERTPLMCHQIALPRRKMPTAQRRPTL